MSTDHKLMYEEAKKRLFGTSQNEELDEILISEGYLDIIFASDLNTNLSTIIKFIEMYKSSIIKSIILDDCWQFVWQILKKSVIKCYNKKTFLGKNNAKQIRLFGSKKTRL